MEAILKRGVLTRVFSVVTILWGILAFRHNFMLNAQSPVSWITVRDTREEAFSIEVPKGWKISGGMFRYAIAYPRPHINMISPDGKTTVRVGDATIPNYSTPNPWIPAKFAGQDSVAPYPTGDVFATKYGQARFSTMCQSVQVKESHPKTPKYHQPGQGMVRVTGGETNFTCTANGQPMAGYVYAETLLVGTGGPNSKWYVVALGSYLAPAAQAEAAGDILKHSGDSIALNPEWVTMQNRLVAAATRINLQTAQHTMDDIAKTNARQAQWSKNMRQQTDNFNDILNGVTLIRDPTSGVVREVPTMGGGPIWIDPHNDVVVNSALSPGSAFHPLTPISR